MVSLSASELSLLAQSHNDVSYVVFDMEMTGGNPLKNDIMEIYALRYHKGKVEGEPYHQLINPGRKIPPIVRRMTQISDSMVARAPKIEEVFADFLDFVGGGVLVSHNIQSDLKFIQHSAQKIMGKKITNFYLCTHILAQHLIPQSPKKSLGGLCEHLGVTEAKAHRASGDTLMTLKLFQHLQSCFTPCKLHTLEDLLRLQKDLDTLVRLGWSLKEETLSSVPKKAGVFWLYGKEGEMLMSGSSTRLRDDISTLPQREDLSRSDHRRVLQACDLSWQESSHFLSAFTQGMTEASQNSAPHLNTPYYDLVVIQAIPLRTQKKYNSKNNYSSPYLITVGRAKGEALWMVGPVVDRQRGHEWLQELSSWWGLSYDSKGHRLIVEREQAWQIKEILSSKNGSGKDSWWGGSLNKFMSLWKIPKKNSGRETPLPKLDPSWCHLSSLWGVVCVAGAKKEKMEVYPVCQGELQNPRFLDYFSMEKEGKVALKPLMDEMKQQRKSFAVGPRCTQRLNLGLWVATRLPGDKDLAGACFISMDKQP